MASTTLKRIHAEIEKLRIQASQMEDQERKTAIKTIKALVVQFDISAAEIGLDKKSKKRVSSTRKSSKKGAIPKFRKGDMTWSGGRGVKPKWVRDIIEKDGLQALEKYRI